LRSETVLNAWNYNVKMNLEEIWWEDVPKTLLAEVSGQWHALMSMVLTPLGTSQGKEFLG